MHTQNIIKTISFDEGEILRNIIKLHCHKGFELDPCFSIGNIYKRTGIDLPNIKFDINPQKDGVLKSSADDLPIENKVIESILFDPPFLINKGPSYINGKSKMTKVFRAFPSIKELFEWYSKCLIEFKRILIKKGVLVFKCQDTVSSGKQNFSHCYIMEEAVKIGFYPKDLFILLAKNRMIGHNHKIQKHARKYHCYYWVFINN